MLSVRQILKDIASGQTSASGAIGASVAAIAAKDGMIGAFASLTANPVPGTGPLSGIAVGVKDIIDTSDLPTAMGSPIFAGWQPRADASIVAAVRASGATVIGKTETTAFAFLDPARTGNPHDPAATPGGSSAGSAAAVAAGMIPLAIGTQTGGSVIRPASFCGVAAIKPSFGLLPMVGIKPFAWSLDTAGLFASGVDDLACALACLTGRADLDPPEASLKGLRIGVLRQAFAGEAEPAGLAALEQAVRVAKAAGATLVDVQEPDELAIAFAAHGPLQAYEAACALAWEYQTQRSRLPPLLKGYLDKAQDATPGMYDDARRDARRGRDRMRSFMKEADAFLTFSAPGEAPAGRETTGDPRFNRLWTLMGTPCVGVPATRGHRNLPVSVQVICRFGQDAQALAIAKALEAALAKFS